MTIVAPARAALLLLPTLAACVGAPRDPDTPRLPAEPAVRVAIAPIAVRHWDSEREPREVRPEIAFWLRGWHGMTVAPAREVDPVLARHLAPGQRLAPDAFIGQSSPEARQHLAAACRTARELGVDALLYGAVTLEERGRRRCVREELLAKNPRCEEWSEVERTSAAASLHLVVVQADTCGYSELDLDGAGSESDPDDAVAVAWAEVRHLVRRQVPDTVRAPARHLVPPGVEAAPAIEAGLQAVQ